MRQRISIFITSIFAIGLLALAGTPAQAQESKLDEVLARGHLIVGVTSEAPPFGFIDDNANLVGFDIDIARLLSKQIFDDDRDVEFVKQGFAARWANAQSGKIDVGIQITTIWPQRALKVAFTRPYLDSGLILLVSKGSPIKKTADLNNEKYTVANLTSVKMGVRADKYFPKAKRLIFDGMSSQINAVKVGRAHAAQLDLPQALWLVNKFPDDYTVTDDVMEDPNHLGIFTRTGDFKWWLTLDTIVAEWRGGGGYSEYAKIYKKWFGKNPDHAKYYYNK